MKRLSFDSAWVDCGRHKLDPQKLRGDGFAGFRVHCPLNKPGCNHQVVVFLGAGCFRGAGKGQHCGLSACGLARGTAAGQGEEFPRFSEFWIERSQPGTAALKIFGLLDSPRLAGAYRFVLAPVRMLLHAQFVFAALTGWKLDGKSPPRDNAAVALGQPCGSGPLAARASFC